MRFQDRRDAGRQLAAELELLNLQDPVIIGLPRGGVPVAYEVALALGAPLDIIIVRKVGAPQNPEYGIGAIAEGHEGVINRGEVERLAISDAELQRIVANERDELERRRDRFRARFPVLDVQDKTAVIVDDGLATGVTASVAVRALRDRGARSVVLAVPVGAPPSVDRLRQMVDRLVCLDAPPEFRAVGTWYDDFQPTTDDEVIALLAAARQTEA